MKRAILLTAILLVSSLRADVVLQADFKGEAAGTGGATDIMTTGGSATIAGLPGNTASISKESPDLGAGAFLRTVVPADAPSGAPQAGVKITPASPQSGLGAMFTNENDDPKLNGGFDFFYRTNLDVTATSNDHVMRAIDTDNKAAGGLTLIFLSQQGALRVDIDGPEGAIDGASHFQGNFPLKANTVYHFGVTFSTAKHITTGKIFAVEGAGAIDTADEKNSVAMATFVLNKDVVKAGFVAADFEFGAIYNDNKPKQQDFGRLRIYDAVPKTFEALGAAPTTQP